MAAIEILPGRTIRGMGCTEAYQLAMHTLDQYRGTIVACRYVLPPILARPESLATLKALFRDALTRIVLAQPHLQTGITGETTKNPAFVSLDHIDLRNHVQWITRNEPGHFQQLYLETAQAQLDAKFENLSIRPGWKVVVLHEMGMDSIEVLYVWNHPHHDGSSGKIFHRYMLQYLDESTGQDNHIVDLSENSDRWILPLPGLFDKLPPNPELLSWWPMWPRFLLSQLWKEFKPGSIFPPGKTYAHWAPIRTLPYKTQYRNFTVDSPAVMKLVDACRLHHTTLTGLVQALCLFSLSTALPRASGFASRTPYDMRNILPSHTTQYPWLQPKEVMCNYVSAIDHKFDPKLVDTIRRHTSSMSSDSELPADAKELLWSVSARVRREIQARLDSGTWNDLIGIMKLCPNWNNQQEIEMRKTRYLSWLVTNLGVLDGERSTRVGKESWSLCRAELILGAETPSAALSVSIMTVKGSDMCVTCTWQDSVVDAAIGERLIGHLKRWLEEIGS
ncbi:hypothetical protein P280DRAFT_110377 [Massarina eburnea CBS 473.64]|uniref:Alcohol acetyltransferase n=1 Tax=Massarina eburnea CBS 473.64 TaxID=1395130 RepID=A0A6A6RPM3_9PLEO|nr:hypothetical protein P280DRAFT_110377 [Massarina eburnea CBS 473.64]